MQSRKQHASVRNGRSRNVGGGQTADRNLNDIAYRTIKDDIISCALQPGEDISEGVLAARYQLGKAPIRSAMLRLRQEGLVVSRGRLLIVALLVIPAATVRRFSSSPERMAVGAVVAGIAAVAGGCSRPPSSIHRRVRPSW